MINGWETGQGRCGTAGGTEEGETGWGRPMMQRLMKNSTSLYVNHVGYRVNADYPRKSF